MDCYLWIMLLLLVLIPKQGFFCVNIRDQNLDDNLSKEGTKQRNKQNMNEDCHTLCIVSEDAKNDCRYVY